MSQPSASSPTGEKAFISDKHSDGAASRDQDGDFAVEQPQLQRRLKSRHLQMIAIGTSLSPHT